MLKVTQGDELHLNYVVYMSNKSVNPTCSEYQRAWVNHSHLVMRRDKEFRDNKKLYFGMCSSQDVCVIVETTYFGFTDDIIKQSLKDHRKKVDVFKKFPFSFLSPEEKAEEIREMRKTRMQGLSRDFIVKNKNSSSREHIIKADKLASNQVD